MIAQILAQSTETTGNSFILFDIFAGVLNFFFTLVPSYGFAIIALTCVVMAVLTPLTFKGTRSMMVMQQLQPEIKKIQSRFKDDRQKQNEELLKFYKENNINPMGGCLPLLVQMPIFFVLYAVLRGLTQRVPVTTVGWPAGQLGSGANLTVAPLANFQPGYLNPSSEMYQSLTQTNTMQFFGMDLAQSASDTMRLGIVKAIPYFLLIAVVAVTGVVQQRQIQGRNQNQQTNPQQQMIMKIMPFFLPVISFGLPSGLVLYFVVSNLWRIGQQEVISRSIYGIKRGDKSKGGGAKGGGAKGGGAKGGGPKGGGPKGGGPKDASPNGGRGSNGSGARKTATKQSSGTAKAASSTAKRPSGAKSKGGSTTSSSRGTSGGGRGARAASQPKNAKPNGSSSSNRSGGSGGTTPAAPALQPRARKNKKR